ncbi:MAG TPA: GFA family protein [Polyangia bacterium]|nr:GFA family protein [Polyangia bacterium]
MTSSEDQNQTKTISGSCHCGAVRFRATADLSKGGSHCNCSICTKLATLGGIVKPEAFQLVSTEDNLSSYTWGGRTATRYFCKQCGTHCFARGFLAELGGDYVSVNYNCLDGVELSNLKVVYWDGRHNNWHAGPRDRPWAILSGAGA